VLLGYMTSNEYFKFKGVVNAITEDENEVKMRDASASKERPKIDAYDMDEATTK